MARIRSIKPKFFRHESLQDLERSNPGKYPMLVFAGLWTLCDRYGRFEWQPRQLKLDILPFLDFDMAQTLELLAQAKQIVSYEVGGKRYGLVPTFEEHQRITGSEAKSEGLFPAPPETTSVSPEKPQGNNLETLRNQQGSTSRAGIGIGIGKGNDSDDFQDRSKPLPDSDCGIAVCTVLSFSGIKLPREVAEAVPTIRSTLKLPDNWAVLDFLPAKWREYEQSTQSQPKYRMGFERWLSEAKWKDGEPIRINGKVPYEENAYEKTQRALREG